MRPHLAIARLMRQTVFDHSPGGCWRGLGCFRDKYGYARYCGRFLHRWSWLMWRGVIPEGLNVLHHCDVPDCWRPSHLYLGTQRENNLDAYARNRRRRDWGTYWGDPGKPPPKRGIQGGGIDMAPEKASR